MNNDPENRQTVSSMAGNHNGMKNRCQRQACCRKQMRKLKNPRSFFLFLLLTELAIKMQLLWINDWPVNKVGLCLQLIVKPNNTNCWEEWMNEGMPLAIGRLQMKLLWFRLNRWALSTKHWGLLNYSLHLKEQ